MTTVATLVVLLLSLLIGTMDVGATHSKCPKTSQPSSGKWSLLWRDEFSGSKIDGSKWSYQLGDGSEYGIPGWGNGESQRYTDSRRNAYVSGGRLILKAVARGNDITSARLRTIGKFDVRPGYKGFNTIRVSVRVKVPGAGPGMWGAAWMLPSTKNSTCSGCGRYGVWAASGEIDIFEAVNEMKEVQTTVHYGGEWPDNRAWTSSTRVDASQWTVMTVVWEKDRLTWYMNNNKVHEAWSGQGSREGWYTSSTRSGKMSTAPFDQNFHIILNLATGGGLTGNVDRQTVLDTLRAKPRTMHVDWVRVHGRR